MGFSERKKIQEHHPLHYLDSLILQTYPPKKNNATLNNYNTCYDNCYFNEH